MGTIKLKQGIQRKVTILIIATGALEKTDKISSTLFVCFVLFCFAFMTDQLTHDKHTWVLGGKQDLNGVSRLLAAVTPGWGGLESPSSFAENR